MRLCTSFPFQVYDYDGNLTVRIDETSIGKYICRASVKGFREISASAKVFMRGPPKILNTEAIFYGRVGSNVELSCDAFAVPPPATIQWSNYGFSVPINQASDHFRLQEHPRKDGFRSKLIIRPVTESDFGDYNCTVQNSHGVDSYIITLKEEQSLPLITILSAVIGGVLLTVLAILFIILCRRSSAMTLKAMGNGEKQYQNGSNTGAGSTLTSVPSKAGQMTTTGTSMSRSYAGTVDSGDMVKSSINGTALLDASLANDGAEDWDTDAAQEDTVNDSGALLLKQKPLIMQQQQQNFANFPMDVGYQAYVPPYGMYQPPPPLPANVMDNNLAFDGLNVTDPRYAAKYGNPYLRGPGVPPDMPHTPGNMGSPKMNPRNYSFATLNRGYQQVTFLYV